MEKFTVTGWCGDVTQTHTVPGPIKKIRVLEDGEWPETTKRVRSDKQSRAMKAFYHRNKSNGWRHVG